MSQSQLFNEQIREIRSPKNAALLTYFLRSTIERTEKRKLKDAAPRKESLFTEVKRGVAAGDIIDPIDESYEGYKKWMELIKTPSITPVAGKPSVTIVGAGVSGLCAGFELKRRGFDVRILEASSRVGGRVITFREPFFAPGLHGEGGAMRIPANHFLLRQYIDEFGLQPQLFEFEMENKYIYLSGMPEKKRTMLYRDFDDKLQKLDEDLLKLFPNLTKDERGKTCDQLFDKAVQPVRKLWSDTFLNNKGDPTNPLPEPLIAAYTAITKAYDKHSLRSYLTEEAKWSQDAINLYDLGNAHVVFDNGFIESFKDAFLSSNEGGGKAGMQQLANGMDEVPKGFLKTYENKGVKESLLNDITFGARVTKIATESVEIGIPKGTPVIVTYANDAGKEVEVKSDYLILAIPYTAQRAIQKSHAFDTAQEMAIRDVRYVEVTKVLLQYKERWWTKIFQDGSQGKDYDGGLVSDLPIRYTMFPKEYRTPSKEDPPPLNPQFDDTKRGVVMAAYTFEQDATILGSLHPHRRIAQAAANLDTIFPSANSLSLFEASASQVFPADELAGGSAFCYFGPGQKGAYLDSGVMMKSDWNDRVFFAGEQASFTHGWIQGALEAALRCVLQVYEIASKAPVLTAKEVTHEVALKGKEEVGQ